jgi:hypothetical protein
MGREKRGLSVVKESGVPNLDGGDFDFAVHGFLHWIFSFLRGVLTEYSSWWRMFQLFSLIFSKGERHS